MSCRSIDISRLRRSAGWVYQNDAVLYISIGRYLGEESVDPKGLFIWQLDRTGTGPENELLIDIDSCMKSH